jgi:hypothetical protein
MDAQKTILASLSDHIVVGMEATDDTTVVALGLKIPTTENWLLYHCDADEALDIARVLTKRAKEIKNGR